jgi:hypothetical protein
MRRLNYVAAVPPVDSVSSSSFNVISSPLSNVSGSSMPIQSTFTPFGGLSMVLPPYGRWHRRAHWHVDMVCLAFAPPPMPPMNRVDSSNENMELAHVQARLQCLQNMRNLLDASTIQMQQYMNIVTTSKFVDSTDKSNSNKHTHTYIYIYIYMCVCVCVCAWRVLRSIF